MNLLKQRILSDGQCLDNGTLKVDNFINHQMDPALMMAMAQEIANRFENKGINKIVTIEASGIAPAILVGYLMQVPVVFAKKNVPSTMEHMISTPVFSFTKKRCYDVGISRNFLSADDHILFVDDFLANGNAAMGIIDIANKAGAQIAGMAFLIEKGFQNGRQKLLDMGIHIESLAIIKSLDNCTITFE